MRVGSSFPAKCWSGVVYLAMVGVFGKGVVVSRVVQRASWTAFETKFLQLAKLTISEGILSMTFSDVLGQFS